jgi:hypothetical protein
MLNELEWGELSDEDHESVTMFIARFQDFSLPFQRLLLEMLGEYHARVKRSWKATILESLEGSQPPEMRRKLLRQLEVILTETMVFYRSKKDPARVWNGIGHVPAWLAEESAGQALKLWRVDKSEVEEIWMRPRT